MKPVKVNLEIWNPEMQDYLYKKSFILHAFSYMDNSLDAFCAL